MTLPKEAVETVDSVSVLGAKIMRGTWSGGEQHVLIAEAAALDPVGAQLSVEAGELPALEVDA